MNGDYHCGSLRCCCVASGHLKLLTVCWRATVCAGAARGGQLSVGHARPQPQHQSTYCHKHGHCGYATSRHMPHGTNMHRPRSQLTDGSSSDERVRQRRRRLGCIIYIYNICSSHVPGLCASSKKALVPEFKKFQGWKPRVFVLGHLQTAARPDGAGGRTLTHDKRV
jgi:hypothetical protein